MSNFLIAPAIMTGLGLFFAVILAVAYRFLRVPEDPRIEAAEDLLPGSNCGACGEPGCHAFAERLVQGELAPSRCTVASADGIDAIAELLDVDAGEQEKRIARLHCAGGRGRRIRSPSIGASRAAAPHRWSPRAARAAPGAASGWRTAAMSATSTPSR